MSPWHLDQLHYFFVQSQLKKIRWKSTWTSPSLRQLDRVHLSQSASYLAVHLVMEKCLFMWKCSNHYHHCLGIPAQPWWNISVVQVIQVIQLIQVIQVRLEPRMHAPPRPAPTPKMPLGLTVTTPRPEHFLFRKHMVYMVYFIKLLKILRRKKWLLTDRQTNKQTEFPLVDSTPSVEGVE